MSSLKEIFNPLSGERLKEWFADLTTLWHNAAPIEPEDHYSPKGMTQWIHYNNFLLWHLEDEARCKTAKDEVIAKCKRAIDKHNQLRNDAIEHVDIWLENALSSAGITAPPEVEINSETPGAIIDRLSIICLKIFHMSEEAERDDADKEHRKNAEQRLAVLSEQRDILAASLDKLLLDLRMVKKRHKIYRQYKMYNDPKYNPVLYKK